jgi:hypothetical protein
MKKIIIISIALLALTACESKQVEEVRGFLEASNRQFEQGGIYLERALFKRDDNGVLTGITLSYEDRTTSDTQETRKEKQV